jgi:hypothetical protein
MYDYEDCFDMVHCSGSLEEVNNFTLLLVNVLNRLPEDDADTLTIVKRVFFFIPVQPYAYKIFVHPKPDSDIPYIWTICFPPDRLNDSPDHIKYTIAHEMAHAFLDHSEEHRQTGEAVELAADKQVIKWGFEKEWEAHSTYKYLFDEKP